MYNHKVIAQVQIPNEPLVDLPKDTGEPLIFAFGTTVVVWIVIATTATAFFFGFLIYRLQVKAFNTDFDRKLLLKAFDKALQKDKEDV